MTPEELEQVEDAQDVADARVALADPNPSIPYEQVRSELGLDEPRKKKPARSPK